MSDEIKQRLQESADQCIKAYEVWRKAEKDTAARETLLEAVHDIRKVASRLEIELAVSERDQMTQKPMPIPQNRNAQGKIQNPNNDRPKNENKAKTQDLKAGLKRKSPPKDAAPKEDPPKEAQGE